MCGWWLRSHHFDIHTDTKGKSVQVLHGNGTGNMINSTPKERVSHVALSFDYSFVVSESCYFLDLHEDLFGGMHSIC